MSIWTLWHPDYWLSGVIKAITALVSVYTVIKLLKFFPVALSLPDPAILEKANQDLAQEVEFRHKAEQELGKERLFLKTMLDNLSVGVIACDEKGTLALFNPASQKIFGVSKPLQAQQWAKHYNLFYPDGKTYLAEQDIPLSRAFKGETFTEMEITTISPDGQPLSLITNGCPITDHNGKKFGAVVTIRDVTEGKQAEAQLNQLNVELLQSNQELEQFAYVASHDLREPLRMVISFTQLLAQRYGGKLDPDADTIIGFAVDGAKRMEILIEDLLLYSRLGKQNKTFKIVNCNLIIDQALSNLQLSIKESNVKITVKPLPQIVGDEVQLVQLFQNLINNAITYRRTDQPYPEISITATALDIGWLFSVADNGIGIDSENYHRIFEVFQRLHPKEKYSGTGIGLAICKKIVERHGGRIWVESELGQGSIFRFTLNCQRVDTI
ncbi:MAG: ATP-binding protein [Cyanobacteria bacterium P01_A01_bin.83]